jgi:hypothetical protein
MKTIRNLYYRLINKKRRFVISSTLNGLHLSDKAIERLIELGMSEKDFSKLHSNKDKDSPNKIYYGFVPENLKRDDPRLIQIVEELKWEVMGNFCKSVDIVEVPAYINVVVEKDGEMGNEWIAEKHRVWDGKYNPKYIPTETLLEDIDESIAGITGSSWSLENKIRRRKELKNIILELINRKVIDLEKINQINMELDKQASLV